MDNLIVLGLLTIFVYSNASFCGDTLIPYSVEVLPTGQPILGCARPTCFGWNPDGTPLPIKSSFFRINQHADGFTRDDPTFIPPFDISDPRVYPMQNAKCESVYESPSCSAQNQWIGGIVPLLNVSSSPTAYICCTYEPLKISSDRGIATISSGQIVIGGEVYDNGKQYAFDYISNIEKRFHSNGTISYEINIRRMACLSAHDFGSKNEAVQNSEAIIQNLNDIEVEKVVAHDVSSFQPSGKYPIPLESKNPKVSSYPVAQQIPDPIRSAYVQPAHPTSILSYGQASAPAAPYVPQYSFGIAQPAALQAYFCFTGDTKVNLIDGSIKRMKDLRINDWVAAVGEKGIEYVSVSYWIHKNPEQVADFRKIQLEDGTELKMTDNHHIYKSKCSTSRIVKQHEVSRQSVLAQEVVPGDCLYKIGNTSIKLVKVKNVTIITETGIYSPMTASGKIIVNDIYASCHSVLNSHSLQNTLFSYINELNKLISPIFGVKETQDVPIGIGLIIQLIEIILPKQLITM